MYQGTRSGVLYFLEMLKKYEKILSVNFASFISHNQMNFLESFVNVRHIETSAFYSDDY
jgi:hypothetical protein